MPREINELIFFFFCIVLYAITKVPPGACPKDGAWGGTRPHRWYLYGEANLANIVACAPYCPLKALLLSFQIVKHNSALFWILCTVTSAWSTLVIVQKYPNTLEAGVQILVFYTLFVSDQIFGFLVLHVPHYSRYPAQTPRGQSIHLTGRLLAISKMHRPAEFQRCVLVV